MSMDLAGKLAAVALGAAWFSLAAVEVRAQPDAEQSADLDVADTPQQDSGAEQATGGGDGAPSEASVEGKLAIFELERGLYVASDLGVFLTFGGVNGVSNVQPYLGLKVGHDLGDYFGVQLALAAGYASGNPVSENDVAGAGVGGREIEDYSLLSASVEGVAAWRPTERFAVEPKLGAGITRIYPALTSPQDPTATLNPVAPQVGGGIDLKYLTLLTDFSAGISLTAYYVIGPNIPALGTGAVVRYTF